MPNGVSQTPDRRGPHRCTLQRVKQKDLQRRTRRNISPLDYVLTAVMVALAVVVGLANVTAAADADLAHPLDSDSPLMVPVFVAAALPILWRRRGILAAIGVSLDILAASVPSVRVGHPLWVCVAAVVRHGVRSGALRRQQAEPAHRSGRDPGPSDRHTGPGLLDRRSRRSALSVPVAAIFYGIGLLVRSRARKAAEPTLLVEHVHV